MMRITFVHDDPLALEPIPTPRLLIALCVGHLHSPPPLSARDLRLDRGILCKKLTVESPKVTMGPSSNQIEKSLFVR